MFRKIHSKREPGVTLGSELKKEFADGWNAIYGRFLAVLQRNPKFIFGSMLVLMFSSLVLSFFVLGKVSIGAKKINTNIIVRPVTDGLGQIMRQGDALRQTIAVKQEIELLLARDTLSHSDSLKLEKAIDQLMRLQDTQPIKSPLP